MPARTVLSRAPYGRNRTAYVMYTYTHIYIYIYIHTYTHTCIYIYIYIYISQASDVRSYVQYIMAIKRASCAMHAKRLAPLFIARNTNISPLPFALLRSSRTTVTRLFYAMETLVSRFAANLTRHVCTRNNKRQHSLFRACSYACQERERESFRSGKIEWNRFSK